MTLFNPNLITRVILPGLYTSTTWSIPIAAVVGTGVGWLMRAIQRNHQQTLAPAIVGAFLGTLLLGMLPLIAAPSIVGDGLYGGYTILIIACFSLPLGSVAGALTGSLIGHRVAASQGKQLLLILLASTYIFMAIVVYGLHSIYCPRPGPQATYCQNRGIAGSPS